MPVLYVQEPKEPSRTEVQVESVEDLAVKDFKDSLLEKFDVPLEEQCLIFAGRVLRPGKTLGHYKVTEGCTVYLLRKKKREESPAPEHPRSGFGNIISNRRILRVIGRVLSNPTLIQAMIAGTPLVDNPQIREALQSPELLSSLGEPDAIADYLRSNPQMAFVTEGILRMYSMLFGGAGGDPDAPEDDEDIVDMVEGNLEDDMEQRNEENMRRLARQQEEMFEHSRALAAHHRRQSTEEPSQQQQPAGTGPGSQGEGASAEGAGAAGGRAITQGMLATALAGAISTAQSSPHVSSSQDFSSSPLSSGPASLSSDLPLVNIPVPPSDTALGQSEQVGTVTNVGGAITSSTLQQALALGQSEQVGTVTNVGGAITSSALQQALASAMSTTVPQGQAAAQERQPSIRDRYRSQLAQLHNMGITDDVACLHTLEATRGDIQATLEILLGGGQ